MIGEATGLAPVLDRQPLQAGDVGTTYADISKARARLGYDPKTPVRAGLERFVDWYRKGPGRDLAR
jgi:UDP-glucuronate 4-epimerase